jgi:hypothetical protein
MAVTVDGVEIPENEIQTEMAQLRLEYAAYVRRQGGEPDEGQLREWAVENLIEAFLFRREAVASQPAPSDDRVRQELETHASAYENIPEGERQDRARVALQQRRLMREIRKGVKPPGDAEIRAFYDSDDEVFMAPVSLRLSHICRVITTPDSRPSAFLDLLRVKADVEQGRMTWIEAVEAHSDTGEQDRGMFDTVVRGELPEECEASLFALKPGELSEVVDFKKQTLHLFKVLVRFEPEKMPFASVKEHLKSVLFDQVCQDAVSVRFDALKAAVVIVRDAGCVGAV